MAIFASCSVQFRGAVLCCCRRWPPSACLQTPTCAPPSRKSRPPLCSCSVTWPFSRPLVRASGPLWHSYQTCGAAALVCPFSMSALSHSAGHMPVLHACFVLARDCSGQWGHPDSSLHFTSHHDFLILDPWTTPCNPWQGFRIIQIMVLVPSAHSVLARGSGDCTSQILLWGTLLMCWCCQCPEALLWCLGTGIVEYASWEMSSILVPSTSLTKNGRVCRVNRHMLTIITLGTRLCQPVILRVLNDCAPRKYL